jgi:hypothetical protein
MGRIKIKLTWGKEVEELEKLLKDNNLVHLKKHDGDCLKVGDALKSEKGVIVRVVENVPSSRKDCFILANKNVSSEELEKQFLGIECTFDKETYLNNFG